MVLTEKQRRDLKYDFCCKVDTVQNFLEMFSLINGSSCVYTALKRFLDERGFIIVKHEK